MKKELFDLGKQLLSEWESLEVVADVPDRNLQARVKSDEDGPVTMLAHIKADGFPFEKFKVHLDDVSSIEKMYQGRLTMIKLVGQTTETTSALILLKVKMPALLSNRSSPTLTYTAKDEGDNGWHYEFASSLGTKSLVKKYKDEIGSDVVAYNYLSMLMWRQYEGGIELYNIHKADMKGWVPISI